LVQALGFLALARGPGYGQRKSAAKWIATV
jgi:hypothetical protein